MSKIQHVGGKAHVSEEGVASLPHVLFVVDGFPKALGGGERVALRLAASLGTYGYRASILTLALHPQSEFQPAHAPCPVYLLPLTNTYGLNALRGAFALRRFLREQNVQIVQTFFESSDLWAGTVTRLFSRAKLIWSRRDMGILRTAKHRRAYRAMRRFPHAVMAVSARVAQHVIEVDRVPAARVRVVHNGLDLPSPHADTPGAIPSRTPKVVTTIGNVREVKGHDVLLEAARLVLTRFPDVLFTVAGDVLEPAYYEKLQQRINELGLTARFIFLGRITDLQAHLQTASIFVLPSRSEGFSNALVEAMASGIPSIATDVGGNGEAIEDHRSGLLVPSEDPESLARAIEKLLENPDLASRLSLGGRQIVEQRFSTAAMMRNVAGIYSTLLRKGRLTA